MRDYQNLTPLALACKRSDVPIIKRFIAAGADIHSKNKANVSLIHTVLTQNNLPVAQLLVDEGARLDWHGSNRVTLLHQATASANVEMVRFLLKNDVDVNVEDIGGVTPLMVAAMRDATEAACILLDHGALIETEDRSGKTPLFHGALSGSLGVSSLLLERGCDPMKLNKSGQRAKSAAHEHQHKAVEELIMKSLETAGRVIHDPRTATPLILSLAALENGYDIRRLHNGQPFIHVFPKPEAESHNALKEPHEEGKGHTHTLDEQGRGTDVASQIV